jgi:energy-coupling factor transport system permease protein
MRAMYVEHISRPSVFGRLDVRTKLFMLFLVSVLIFVWENVYYVAAMFLVVLLLALTSHLDRGLMWRLFRIMLPFIALTVVIQGLFNIRGVTPLLTLPQWVPVIGGRVSLYWEGVVFGAVVVFRLLSPLFAMPLVVMTTDVNDLVVGLTRIRVPYKVAFIFSITLRFVPFIFGEIDAIMEAQRLRGLALEKMNYFRRIPVFASLAVPLILGSLLKAQTLDVVLQSKAFSGNPNRTYLTDIRLRGLDYVLIAGGAVLFVGAIVTRLAFGWGGFIS